VSKAFVGESRPNAKLTNEQVRLIRESTDTQRNLAIKYMVSQSQICRIRTKEQWAHIR